jgi:hypothetical protein
MILTTHINKTLKLRFIARNYKLNPLLTPQVTALPLNSITLNPSNRYFSSTGNGEKPVEKVQKLSLFDRWFGKEASVASPTFKNRWAMVVPAVLTHICIGKSSSEINFHHFPYCSFCSRLTIWLVISC